MKVSPHFSFSDSCLPLKPAKQPLSFLGKTISTHLCSSSSDLFAVNLKVAWTGLQTMVRHKKNLIIFLENPALKHIVNPSSPLTSGRQMYTWPAENALHVHVNPDKWEIITWTEMTTSTLRTCWQQGALWRNIEPHFDADFADVHQCLVSKFNHGFCHWGNCCCRPFGDETDSADLCMVSTASFCGRSRAFLITPEKMTSNYFLWWSQSVTSKAREKPVVSWQKTRTAET